MDTLKGSKVNAKRFTTEYTMRTAALLQSFDL